MNFSHALSSYIDFSRVMSTLYLEGALIITILFVAGAIEAAPYILANFQALTYYVKNFGVRQGLDMYRYLGVQNLPNGVISWLQMDMADGDSSIDDVAPVVDHVKNNGKLPDKYITKAEARKLGWKPKEGNLDIVAPGKMIGGDVYQNRNQALPIADGRVYYEADLNYNGGFRGQDRLIFSNDGLFFITSDHYQTFIQIGEGIR